jgi:hypothetical protein
MDPGALRVSRPTGYRIIGATFAGPTMYVVGQLDGRIDAVHVLRVDDDLELHKIGDLPPNASPSIEAFNGSGGVLAIGGDRVVNVFNESSGTFTSLRTDGT